MKRSQLLEFVRECGLDPNEVRSFTCDRNVITFTVYAVDQDGERVVVNNEACTTQKFVTVVEG